jgi:hypothetical protein
MAATLLSCGKETHVSSSSVVREPGCLFYWVGRYLLQCGLPMHCFPLWNNWRKSTYLNSPNRSLLYPSSSCCSLIFFTIPKILFVI